MHPVLRLLMLCVVLSMGFGGLLRAQEPDIEMDNYVVALLRMPAAGGGALTDQLAAAQEACLRRLDRSGLLVAAGPVKGRDDLRAMLVVRTDSVRARVSWWKPCRR